MVFIPDSTLPIKIPKENLYVQKFHGIGHNIQEIPAVLLGFYKNAVGFSNLKFFFIISQLFILKNVKPTEKWID